MTGKSIAKNAARADGSGNVSETLRDGTRYFNKVELDTAREWYVAALDELIKAGFIEQDPRFDITVKFKIAIPDDFVAAVIGYKGQCVKEVKRISDTDMDFEKEKDMPNNAANKKMRAAWIEGRLRNALMAVHMLQKVMIMLSNKDVLPNDSPCYMGFLVSKKDEWCFDDASWVEDCQYRSGTVITMESSGRNDALRVDVRGEDITQVSHAFTLFLCRLYEREMANAPSQN